MTRQLGYVPAVAGARWMVLRLSAWIGAGLLLGVCAVDRSPAAIAVGGLSDEGVYTDSVTFTVPAEAGFAITAELDGIPVAVGEPVSVNSPDYHELFLTKVNTVTSVSENRLVRFIVRDSARGNSEWGLAPWVPDPVIPSSAAEFAAAQAVIDVMAPTAFPAGRPLPIAARIVGEGDRSLRLNGVLTFDDMPGAAVEFRRGWGAGALDPDDLGPGGMVVLSGRAGGRESRARTVDLVESPGWTVVASDVNSSATWGPDGFYRIPQDLAVAAGAVLTIEAGTVVEFGPGVDVEIDGRLDIRGTRERPVVFTGPADGSPWGGCFARGDSSRVDATGAIFIGSGADPDWFSGSGYSAHRKEQATFLFSDGTTGIFTDCAFIGEAGQALHGRNATVTLTRCLVQGGSTTGQFNGGAVTVDDSALIGFPGAGPDFADDDNDGIYFTSGAHHLVDSLFGWLRDDCVDAGSGDAGTVTVERCWFEASFHEAMAWSGAGRFVTVTDCVVVNCGQGIEAGWTTGSSGSINSSTPKTPDVRATGCLVVSGGTGLRFGDNYDWGYNGILDVQDSIVLHNSRNIFGRDWTSWEENLDRMNIRGNRLSAPDPLHPDNAVWDPESDGPLLDRFMAVPGSEAGAGFAEWGLQRPFAALGEPLALGLSSFTSRAVEVEYLVLADGVAAGGGTVRLEPGMTRLDFVPAHGALPDGTRCVLVVLSGAAGGELTGARAVAYVVGASGGPGLVAVPAGSTWRYSDDAVDLGTAWRASGFDDGAWESGPAQLGFGDGDEATAIDGGPSGDRTPTIYFRHRFELPVDVRPASITMRLQRDDGAVVFLNGVEIVRTNMPSGTIGFDTFASGATSGENDFRTFELPADGLVGGTNVLAVEVHQSDAGSSDLSFDLELAVREAGEPLMEFAATPEGAGFLVWTGDGWTAQWSAELAEASWDNLPPEASPLQILPSDEAAARGGAGGRIGASSRAFFRLIRP